MPAIIWRWQGIMWLVSCLAEAATTVRAVQEARLAVKLEARLAVRLHPEPRRRARPTPIHEPDAGKERENSSPSGMYTSHALGAVEGASGPEVNL